MHEDENHKHTVSWHIRDLGRMNAVQVKEVAEWLEKHAVTKRDMQRRVVSKRMFNRLLAARLGMKAADGDVAAIKEWMDRSEGKVADVVISGSFSDLVSALEAGRERLALERAPQDVVVDGEVVAAEEPHCEPTSTDSDTSK